jgi:hypothetical protein
VLVAGNEAFADKAGAPVIGNAGCAPALDNPVDAAAAMSVDKRGRRMIGAGR